MNIKLFFNKRLEYNFEHAAVLCSKIIKQIYCNILNATTPTIAAAATITFIFCANQLLNCALILFIQTLALYKSFTYLLTYLHLLTYLLSRVNPGYAGRSSVEQEKVALDGSVECCTPPPRWCDLELSPFDPKT